MSNFHFLKSCFVPSFEEFQVHFLTGVFLNVDRFSVTTSDVHI